MAQQKITTNLSAKQVKDLDKHFEKMSKGTANKMSGTRPTAKKSATKKKIVKKGKK